MRDEARVVWGFATVTLVLMVVCVVVRVSGEAPRSGSPFASAALPIDQRFVVQGELIERLDAGSYAYFRVRDDHGADHWVVSLSLASPPETSARVRADVLGRAEEFESPRLSRRFDVLLFAIVRAADP